MKKIAALVALFQLLVLGGPALAQDALQPYGNLRVISQESWVEEWDSRTGRWVRVSDSSQTTKPMPVTTITTHTFNGKAISRVEHHQATYTHAATRFAHPVARPHHSGAIARFGPFVVTGETTAVLVGSTDAASPHQFDAMLRAFPNLSRLEMVEAPGTSNDIANLAIGRRIRAAGIATHVPSDGSVRSGAVELFLAGVERTADEGAEFAVHSWLDTYGREADDFSADHPAHRLYLDYYVEMGMSEQQARDFYTMTNSVPHHSALWLAADDMRPWLRAKAEPVIQMAKANAHSETLILNAATFASAQPRLAPLSLDWDHLVISIGTAEDAPVLAQTPSIDYGDLDKVNLAYLDATNLDSALSFP